MRYSYIAHYRCGCTAEKPRKRDLLGYCATHGEDLLEPIIKLAARATAPEEASEGDEVPQGRVET